MKNNFVGLNSVGLNSVGLNSVGDEFHWGWITGVEFRGLDSVGVELHGNRRTLFVRPQRARRKENEK